MHERFYYASKPPTTCTAWTQLPPPTSTPYARPAKMATRTRKAKVSLLDDRIKILNRDALEASSAKQVFRAVSTTLALVRVSAAILRPPLVSHWQLNQDKMIDDNDSVQLSDYCFNVCEVLKTTIQRRDEDGLDESVRVALGDLEKCVE